MELDEKKIALIFIGAAFILGIVLIKGPAGSGQPMPDIRLSSNYSGLGYTETAQPCLGRKQCLYVLLAPWCPSCHGVKGFLKKFSEVINNRFSQGDNSFGLKVIIGRDDEAAILSMAKDIGFMVFLDPERKISDVFPSGVPGWILVDEAGIRRDHGAGLPGDASEWAVDAFLNQFQ
jgi:hypothetical protein